MEIGTRLDERREVTVSEYEEIERLRELNIEEPTFAPELNPITELFEQLYAGKDRLYLKSVDEFYRTYEWS